MLTYVFEKPSRAVGTAAVRTSCLSAGSRYRNLEPPATKQLEVLLFGFAVGDKQIGSLQRPDAGSGHLHDLAVVGQHDNLAGGLDHGPLDLGFLQVGIGETFFRMYPVATQESLVGVDLAQKQGTVGG